MRMRRHTQSDDENDIDMTPMLDVVFIMLIFFIVTTSFVKEAGITVNQPSAETSEPSEATNILIAVTPIGEVWIDKKPVAVGAISATVERLKGDAPNTAVIIQADEDSKSGVLVAVMDQVRLAGVYNITIAADKK